MFFGGDLGIWMIPRPDRIWQKHGRDFLELLGSKMPKKVYKKTLHFTDFLHLFFFLRIVLPFVFSFELFSRFFVGKDENNKTNTKKSLPSKLAKDKSRLLKLHYKDEMFQLPTFPQSVVTSHWNPTDNWQRRRPRYCLRTLFTELFKVLLLQPRGPIADSTERAQVKFSMRKTFPKQS